MMVFYQEKLVFLSVPKTGSTAYERALSARADMVVSHPQALRHASVHRYGRFFAPIYDKACGVELELMAVIRHPVDWLGSWYRYRRRTALDGHPNSTADMSFDAFVEAYCLPSQPAYAQVGDQARFLDPHPDGANVAHVFAYEDLKRLNVFLEKRLGALPDIPHLNVSPAMKLSLSPRIEDALRHQHADAFALHAAALKGITEDNV
ncbi:MAG: sulfotransferase family 2 domain-containing protein [Pseudomonadota bacterium]